MKVLLDECLPRRLKKFLAAHEAQTVPDMGWAGKKNGELLSLLADKFEAFLTIDKNMVYQQNLQHLRFGVVVLSAPSNRLADLELLVPKILGALQNLQPGQIVRLGGQLHVEPDGGRQALRGLHAHVRLPG